ncbi:hypothetical protein C8R44DRAFT_721208 [Mycena epipterygia]|nr:hypothetical protein C8R44DRAFT_721208 [Mycena epipterygia]
MQVLIIGATGYLGGSILSTLQQQFKTLELFAVLRSNKDEGALNHVGVHTLCITAEGNGTTDTLITDWSARVDIVINAADSDSLPLTEAILVGIKRRWQETSKRGLLLHISGVAVFLDERTDGFFDTAGKIWKDTSEDDMKSIRQSALHAPVNLRIMQAGVEDFVNTYTVCPGAIVGQGLGPVKSASFFVKAITEMTLAYQSAVYVGKGENEFNVVGIADVTELVNRVLGLAISELSENCNPYARCFIADSTPASWKNIAEKFGAVLHGTGNIRSPKPESKVIEDVVAPFSSFLGSNLRIAGERSRRLGWSPSPAELETVLDGDIKMALQLRSSPSV